MLLRSTAAALLALSACVTVEDEPETELPQRLPAAEVDSPAVEALADRLPTTPPTWENHRPWPGADALTTLEDGQVKVRISDLLANDVDPDGGRVVFVGLGVNVGGTVSLIEDRVVFAPDADFTGDAYYDYVISDGRLMATGLVKVTVLPVNDAPLAFPGRVLVAPDTQVAFQLDAVDIDGDALMVEILERPAHGALTGEADKYVYAPAAAWTGTDRLVYRVSDGVEWSEPTTVELAVE